MTTVQGAGVASRGDAGAALHLASVSKTFGQHTVLRDIDMNLAPGEVRALVGENGSGKSTLVKILAGYYEPDPGSSIHVGGQSLDTHRPGSSGRAGLRFVHQDLALIDELSTTENLGLGRGFSRRGRPVRWGALRDSAREAMVGLGYHLDVDLPVGLLQASERTAVAVARAVSHHAAPPRVLVLDEPTANLPGPEVERLFELIRRVTATGVGVIFVSHHLSEVFAIADTVTVLRGGALVADRAVSGLTDDTLIELMIGREVDRSRPGVEARDVSDDIVLEVEGVCGDSLVDLDLSVVRGEIVGVAGITGSGREVLGPLLFGADPRVGGRVRVERREVPPARPDLSIRHGMALIPAHRVRSAVLRGHDVAENLSIARLGDFVHRGRLNRRRETEEVARWLSRLDVRPAQPRMLLSQLSGGNAQKVILARWLRMEPKVLVMDEPTQGVDVGAKEDIHQRIEEAARAGAAVLVCSTDTEELARLCTRVVVLARGRQVAELVAPLHPDDITAACLRTSTEGPAL